MSSGDKGKPVLVPTSRTTGPDDEKPKTEKEVLRKILTRIATDQAFPVPVESPPEPDPEISLEEQEQRYRLDQLSQRNVEAKDTHELRVEFSKKLYKLLNRWLIALVIILCASGVEQMTLSLPIPRLGWVTFPLHFHLSDKVLITFITATTANVIGVFVVMAKWLFPRASGKKTTD